MTPCSNLECFWCHCLGTGLEIQITTARESAEAGAELVRKELRTARVMLERVSLVSATYNFIFELIFSQQQQEEAKF